MNKIFILLFSLFISVNIFSLTISEIRNDNNYLCGYGEDESYESANKKALQDLVSQISVQVEANFTDMYEEKDGTLTEFTQSVVNTYSNTTLKNVQSKVDEKSNSGKVIVLRYIPKENITDIFAARKRKIIDYTKTAIKAEQELRIGDALKNYYWALLLLRSHPDNNKIKCNFEDKREFTLITALPDRIERILSFIKFSISGNYYDPEDKKRTIKLDIQIQDQDVQNLDYSFYTGDNWSKNITVKEGIGIAEFYDGNAVFVNELNLKIEYEYFNRIFDNEVREVKDDLTQPEFSSSRLKILLTEKFQESNISNKLQVEIAPVNEDINRIFYEEKIKDILIAIDQKEFAGIKQHFTPKGFETFLKIIHYGNAALTSENFPLSTTKVNKSVIVRSIPMLFSFPQNDRQFVEKLSFIFNEEQKIESINFTLSEKAINDILEKSKKWGTISNKYQIIQFLEYYKTSYCLKDLDFVQKVFAENALIIVGQVLKEDKPIENMYEKLGEKIEYVRLNKQEYIERLESVFRSNEFVNIHFEDNIVKKVNGDEKIYGIQIAQDYYSTNYADKGYLFLMIDLTDEKSPKIYVRSWQPEKNADGSVIGLEDFQLY